MKINLSKVLSLSKEGLQNRNILKSLLNDLYPTERKDINLILSVYDCGIPQMIDEEKAISFSSYHQCIKRLHNEYSIEEASAREGTDAWIEALLGSERLQEIKNEYSEAKINKNDSINVIDKYGVIDENYLNASIIKPKPNPALFIFGECVEGYVVERYIGEEKIIAIPDSYNNKPVYRIEKEAFCRNKYVEVVYLGDAVNVICSMAFAGCKQLKAVFGGEQLICIGHSAFHSCYNLLHMELSNNLVYIGSRVFERAIGISFFKLPESINYISALLFRGCTSLETVLLHENVYGIGVRAFNSCERLKHIDGLDNVKIIGAHGYRSPVEKKKIEPIDYLKEIQSTTNKEIGLFYKLASGYNKDIIDGQKEAIKEVEEKFNCIVVMKNSDNFFIVYKYEVNENDRKMIIKTLLEPLKDVYDGIYILPFSWLNMGVDPIRGIEKIIKELYAVDYQWELE